MASVITAAARQRSSGSPSSPDAARSAPAVQDGLLAQGLDADGAMALADALERDDRLVEAVDALALAARLRRDVATEQRLLRLRCTAFPQLDHALAPSAWPHFRVDSDAPVADGPFEVPASALTPAIFRDGLVRHGHVLVRGLVPPARIARLRECIDEAFRADELVATSGSTPETVPWHDPFEGIPDAAIHRLMVRASHGVLAADAPRALFEYLETLQDLGLRNMIAAYLGERPALSVMKCTLRRADPSD